MMRGVMYCLFDSFVAIYQTGKKSGIHEVTMPFKQYMKPFMDDKLEYLYTEFIKNCEKLVEKFGKIRIYYHSNEIESIVKVIFFESEFNNELTSRMTLYDCIKSYYEESIHGKAMRQQIEEFKIMHDLDRANYYTENLNDRTIKFRGVL